MGYNVGDKVRVISNDMYGKLGFVVSSEGGDTIYTIEMIEKIGWCKDQFAPNTYVSIASNTYWLKCAFELELVEQTNTKTKVNRHTYERKAERSDGITFEMNAIGGRSLKEIEESIKERKESIKRDESLLRSHRNLFGKKSCN